MQDLTSLLCNTGFNDESQSDLIASLRELDDDADGFIHKDQLGQILSTLCEGLDREELDLFMELAVEPDSVQPDYINIQTIASILLPEINTEKELQKRLTVSTMKTLNQYK